LGEKGGKEYRIFLSLHGDVIILPFTTRTGKKEKRVKLIPYCIRKEKRKERCVTVLGSVIKGEGFQKKRKEETPNLLRPKRGKGERMHSWGGGGRSFSNEERKGEAKEPFRGKGKEQ